MIIGGNGFVGKCLVDELEKNNNFNNIIIIDKKKIKKAKTKNKNFIFNFLNLKKTVRISKKYSVNFLLDLSNDIDFDDYCNNPLNHFEKQFKKRIKLFKILRYCGIKNFIYLAYQKTSDENFLYNQNILESFLNNLDNAMEKNHAANISKIFLQEIIGKQNSLYFCELLESKLKNTQNFDAKLNFVSLNNVVKEIINVIEEMFYFNKQSDLVVKSDFELSVNDLQKIKNDIDVYKTKKEYNDIKEILLTYEKLFV